jgi:hypothetical protein
MRTDDATMKEEGAKLVVRVQPDASRNKVLGFEQGVLSMRIVAPPVRGKANQELVKYLADVLGIAKSNLVIQKGTTSRKKLLSIRGLSQDRATEIIGDWLEQQST